MSAEAETFRRLIAGCFLFEGAPPEAIERLRAASSVAHSSKGTAVFSEGDESDGLYIIASGLVRVWIGEPDGREFTLGLLEPGDALGEIALLDGLQRTANATAMEDTRAILIRRAGFMEALKDQPDLALHLIELLCERLRRNTEDLSGFAFQDLQRRLARKLCDLAMAHGALDGDRVVFNRVFSQSDLATMLGAGREAVNKRLANWAQKGWVKVVSGKLEILQFSEIRKAAEGDG